MVISIFNVNRYKTIGQAVWCTPLIPALGRQRQVELSEFEVSLVYKASFRTAKAVTQKNLVLKHPRKK